MFRVVFKGMSVPSSTPKPPSPAPAPTGSFSSASPQVQNQKPKGISNEAKQGSTSSTPNASGTPSSPSTPNVIQPMNTGYKPAQPTKDFSQQKAPNSEIINRMDGESKLDSMISRATEKTTAGTASAPSKTPPLSASKPASSPTAGKFGTLPSPSVSMMGTPNPASPPSPTSSVPSVASLAGKPEVSSPAPSSSQKVSFAPVSKPVSSSRLQVPFASPSALDKVTQPEASPTGGELPIAPTSEMGPDGKMYASGESKPVQPPILSSGAKQAASSGFSSGQRFGNMLMNGSGSEFFSVPTQMASNALQSASSQEASANAQANNAYQAQAQADLMRQKQQAQNQALGKGIAMTMYDEASRSEDLSKGMACRRIMRPFSSFSDREEYRYVGSPYFAKYLEMKARESKLSAKRAKLYAEKENPTQKETEELFSEENKIEAEWCVLVADLYTWRASEVRKNDKMQKSMNAQQDVLTGADVQKGFYDDYESKLKPFVGTPFYAKAMECISRMEEYRSKARSLENGESNKTNSAYNEMGLNFSSEEVSSKKPETKKEISKLWKKHDEEENTFCLLQAELFSWAAKKLREEDSTQKSVSSLLKGFYDDFESKLKPFVGTPFHAKALELLSEYLEADHALSEFYRNNDGPYGDVTVSHGYNRMGLNFDSSSEDSKKNKEYEEKRKKLRSRRDKAEQEMSLLQAELFSWAAQNLRKEDKTQKALEISKSMDTMSPNEYVGIGTPIIRQDPFEAETPSRRVLVHPSQPFVPLEEAQDMLDLILAKYQ